MSGDEVSDGHSDLFILRDPAHLDAGADFVEGLVVPVGSIPNNI